MPGMTSLEIPGYPGYFASDDGRVWSERQGARRELATFVVRLGNYQRRTTNLEGRKGAKVATLVCETFHGPRPPGHEVAHVNGDSLDNRAVNLAWKTKAENDADKVLHGTLVRGSACHQSKLSEADVREIRSLAGKVNQREIADRFGIGQPLVSQIVNRRKWAWLE